MNTSVYDKLQKVLDDRNVEGYLGLIHDDAQIISINLVTGLTKVSGCPWWAA